MTNPSQYGMSAIHPGGDYDDDDYGRVRFKDNTDMTQELTEDVLGKHKHNTHTNANANANIAVPVDPIVGVPLLAGVMMPLGVAID